MKPLGTLDYHKKSCQSLAFARSDPQDTKTTPANSDDNGDVYDEQEMSAAEKAERCRWLAAGSQDQRVSMWELMSFSRQ